MKPHITITLNAGCTEFSIDNKTTGKKFELSGLPGDAMTIDVDNENCIMSERTGSVNIYNYFNLLIVAAKYPAPNPLSMLTTDIPDAQLFNIAKSAVSPLKLAP